MIESSQIVNRAFSKQSIHYDRDDFQNIIINEWREQVYHHVNQFLKPDDYLLELNAGTGIDALHFASSGIRTHATDLSDGMIREIENKIRSYSGSQLLTCQQLSYDQLDKLSGRKFDYVFSNFGGLNCIQDLTKVTRHLPNVLTNGAYVTWVIMPKVYLWELAGIFKGNKNAFRRLKRNGVIAHLEGEHFPTFYHSLSEIKKAFGTSFKFIQSEGLGSISPPPHRDDFAKNKPSLYSALRNLDQSVRHIPPFNRWADHIIVTFQHQH
jgi:ubiquinone/menaquinone biosynthesis C-methylase UbiE